MKFLLIGLGVFGRSLAHHLAAVGAEVIALDRREENVSAVKDEVTMAVCAPFDDPAVLTRFPIRDFDAVLMAIGDDFEASMAFTMKAQELGARRLICRVLSPMHRRLLELLKVSRLVVPEEFAARGLAHSLLLRGVMEGIDMGSGYALVDLAVPAAFLKASADNRIRLFEKHKIRLVCIKRPDKAWVQRILGQEAETDQILRTHGHVHLTDPFQEGDVLVLFGHERALRDLLEDLTGPQRA